MSFLDKLERNFGRFAIFGITRYLIIGQVLVWFALDRGVVEPGALMLRPILALHGQWWTVLTFLLVPPLESLNGIQGILFTAFAWWLFYLLGTGLEAIWGSFRYNVFLLVGYLATVAAGFLFPLEVVPNVFLAGSVFVAFAYLNPDFELAIFLVLPIKIKWLALLAWLVYARDFIMGDWSERAQIVATVANFLLFFGPDAWQRARLRTRQMSIQSTRVVTARPVAVAPARHRCRICGKTDRTDPQLDFRYCSKCAGDQCYCPDHIFNHVHVTEDDEAKKTG
jgi:hypothetical protein